jgi:hypothetical protein
MVRIRYDIAILHYRAVNLIHRSANVEFNRELARVSTLTSEYFPCGSVSNIDTLNPADPTRSEIRSEIGSHTQIALRLHLKRQNNSLTKSPFVKPLCSILEH